MIIHNSLRVAMTIVDHMREMEKYYPCLTDTDLLVGTFRNGKVSGLTVSNDNAQRRVNILAHPTSDSPRVVYGVNHQFDYSTGQAHDSAGYHDFDYDDVYSAARFALKYLAGELT